MGSRETAPLALLRQLMDEVRFADDGRELHMRRTLHIAELLNRAGDHERPESRGAGADHEKRELPGKRDSKESVEEVRIIAGRVIATARDVNEPIQRREDGDAPDPRGDEDDSGKSHSDLYKSPNRPGR